MSIYIDKDNHIFVLEHIEDSPVAADINAPLASTIPRKRVIVEYRMKGFLEEQIPSLSQPLFEFWVELSKLLLKVSMQFYLHS